MTSNWPKILLLYTGGTIGMIADEEGGSLKPFRFERLLDQIPELGQLHCQIDTDSLDAPIDSSDISPGHWVRLARRIEKDYYHYDAFVILHGSDTMAYTASALSFMLQNLSVPVILTGSQLPIGIPRSDARENLLTSLEMALAKNEEGGALVPEVAVYFEYDLMRGNRLHKVSSQDFEAFQSINYPKLAEAGVSIKYHRNYLRRPSPGAFHIDTRWETGVGVLTLFPGMQAAFALPTLENRALKGLVLRSFGSGNAPTSPWFLEALEKALARGLKIVNVSQCDYGEIQMGKYEASRRLKELGVISAKDMSFEAALCKLMHLLPQGLNDREFQQRYESNLQGELSD